MSVVKIYARSRLAESMQRPGGVTVREALLKADAVIAAHRAECLDEIDRALDLLSDARLGPAQLYHQASNVIAMCIDPSDADLATAARSLCELLDRVEDGGAVDPRSVRLHLAAMRALHRTEADQRVRREVLAGLAQLATARKPSI